jgi:hypothetical protein
VARVVATAAGGRSVGVGPAAGGAVLPQGAGAALAAQAAPVGGGAARAEQVTGAQRVDGRAVGFVVVVVGLVVAVGCHGDDLAAPGRYAITT